MLPKVGCHIDELTQVGALQHLVLGKKLADVYREHLFTDLVSSEHIKAYSTHYSRTFQSALAFLFGFLNPFTSYDYKNFPEIEAAVGTLFCSTQTYCAPCDKILELAKYIDDFRSDAIQSHKPTNDLMIKLRKFVAAPNDTLLFTSLESLLDAYMSYVCHDSNVPCSLDTNQCASIEDLHHLIASLDHMYDQLASMQYFQHLNLLKMSGFFQQIISHFNNLTQKVNVHKFILYSGHDITLIPMLSVLNLFDGKIPSYASRLIFETYDSQATNESYLRIIYDGTDVTRSSDVCVSSNACVELVSEKLKQHFALIPLHVFKDFFDTKFKEFTNSDNYETACHS
ncbi:2-phosphoxylose phosphatase 1-like protein [Dinothrombium tinctorium]|nr:2-phosphoxylose phosphatase 1-like protein [Dinothrombium tinctorium]